MRISARGVDLVRSFEGLRLEAYRDPGGVPTIGYGHTAGVRMGTKITRSQAIELLREDLGIFERGVDAAVKVSTTQGQFDALVSLAFNTGLGALRSSTLLRKLNARDYAGARAEFDRWVKDNGRTLPGLVRRRNAEQALFGSDSPQPVPPKSRDPLTSAERHAVKRLEHWRTVAAETGWERDGKATEAKIAAETWKKHILTHYLVAINAAVARDVKAGVKRDDALKRHRRGGRTRILVRAVDPPPNDQAKGEPEAGDYPKGLPRAYRRHWRRPWTEAAARHGGFRKWLDAHGMLSPHFSKREAGSKDGVSVDAGGVNKAARDQAFHLERVRHLLGDVPMPLGSWFRSPSHNRAVGGASRSQHMSGKGTDHFRAWVEHLGRARVLRTFEVVFRNGGFGVYPAGSIHGDSRGFRARWTKF